MTDKQKTVDYSDLSGMSDEDLAAQAAELAKQRTTIREAQVAVAAELEIRQSLADMSPETRKVIKLRLGGSIAPVGESRGEVQ